MTSSSYIFHEKLVIQNLRRGPHESVTVRRFRKQKSCCHKIAIPQADIVAPTLTVMQGFKAKKRLLRAFTFLLLHTVTLLHILPFHTFVTQTRIEPGCEGWKTNILTTTLHSLQQYSCKMSKAYLNQIMRKRQWRVMLKCGSLRDFCTTSFNYIFQ